MAGFVRFSLKALWRGYLAFYETELAENVYRTTFERLCSNEITTQNAIVAESA